jgi:hypothetical protein
MSTSAEVVSHPHGRSAISKIVTLVRSGMFALLYMESKP